MTRRTGPARVVAVNAKRPRTPPVVAIVGGADIDPDTLAFLDALLAEGRALVRSKVPA